jgi:hypothetical protein
MKSFQIITLTSKQLKLMIFFTFLITKQLIKVLIMRDTIIRKCRGVILSSFSNNCRADGTYDVVRTGPHHILVD